MQRRAFIGVDPGLSGAIAVLCPDDGHVEVHDVPTFTQERSGKDRLAVDIYALARIMDSISSEFNVVRATIELVGTRPKEGPVGAFSFGKVTGNLEQAVAMCFIPIFRVTPAKWKRVYRLSDDKKASLAIANQTWPRYAHYFKRVMDADRAEALLLAKYGVDHGV